ncbi:MAG: tetratricopeptide repeat protein [Pirellulales bacterium]|nr:tetratricopeptide repeat protein [Pirellulales bacterium]
MMTRKTPGPSRRPLCRCLTPSYRATLLGLPCFLLVFFPAVLPATELILKDGRILEGRIAKVVGLAELPKRPDPEGVGEVPLILLIDDGLRRTYIPLNFVQEVREGDEKQVEEKFQIYQPVKRGGQTVRSAGPALRVQPFDEFGRRIYTMYARGGSGDVIQGITELTPHWAKVEGISHVWDMRIATSSLPRDTLQKILLKQIEPENAEHVKKIARFYLQAERYEEAQKILEALLQKFPDRPELKEQITATVRSIRQLSAQRLLKELKLRRRAGQHRLVYEKLQQFPSRDVAGEILQGARVLIQDYDAKIARRKKILEQIDYLISRISSTPLRQQLEEIRAEIARELSINTLDRFAAFVQNVDDPDMTDEEKLALAVSGWLLGKDAAVVKLSVALSAYRVRGKIRQYVNEPVALERAQIFDGFASEEAAAPATVVKILANMKPPQDLPPPVSDQQPGCFRVEAPGLPGEAPFVYWVQLPPEYDPYRDYPTIVALHGWDDSAEHQLAWWAGDWKSDCRTGQAARQGYIVVAPEWTVEHQRQYNYSVGEHAAVLSCLRDACRRFAVDTDRVFLTGQSFGGDAAWDIGLAHPDLWAGVIPVSARADKFCNFYTQNAKYVPFYVVLGELDGEKIKENAPQLDHYLRFNFPVTVVEYQGRGHEDFYDEILRIFDWMGRQRRNFYPQKFTCSSLREGDTFFWWIETAGLPPRTRVDPAAWPPPTGTHPFQVTGTITHANSLKAIARAGRVTVWVSPKMLDFQRKVEITINNRRANPKEPFIQGNLHTLLEDVRTRGDRQHPFWARFDVK